MTPDEAREVAWRKWAGLDHAHAVARTAFTAGWNARGEYDKEQIAELIAHWEAEKAAAERQQGDSFPAGDGEWHYAEGLRLAADHFLQDLRALAGQSEDEEVTA